MMIKKIILFAENNDDVVLFENVKTVELENWKRNKVYEEVPFCGQKCISIRWVFTEKFVHGKKVIKARLGARGFEETTHTSKFIYL